MHHLLSATRSYARPVLVTAMSLAVVAGSFAAMGNTAYAIDKFKVEKTAVVSTITTGQTASFQIVATAIPVGLNNFVDNFMLQDTLPGPIGVWTLSGPDAGFCTLNNTTNVVSCSFGSPPEGTTFTIFVSRQATNADCNTTITNTVTVTSDDVVFESPAEQADNTSTAHIDVTCAPPSQHITPTGTTCQQFRDGTAANLDFVEYSLRTNGTIKQVDPGVGFYWVQFPSGPISIVQTDNGSTPPFGVARVQVFNLNCDKLTSGVSVTTGTTTTISGSALSAANGPFIALLVFDPNTVVGSGTPVPATVTYTYTTTGIAGSTDSVDLQSK